MTRVEVMSLNHWTNQQTKHQLEWKHKQPYNTTTHTH